MIDNNVAIAPTKRHLHQQNVCGKNDEWYTPAHIVNLARFTLGGKINFDLASCAYANENIQADMYFSQNFSFLVEHIYYRSQWRNGFWCNPPFSQTSEFAEIIVSQNYDRSILKRGLMLTNANTDTRWFHALALDADWLCFFRKRLAFISSITGKPVRGNPKGQVLFGWGCDPVYFTREGLIMGIAVR